MLKTILYSLFFIVGILATNNEEDGTPNRAIKLVAQADGKSFFADYLPLNWFEANDYCESMGMRLAAVTSLTQFSAIRDSTVPEFEGRYWVAGRDAHLQRQFTWDEALTEFDNNYPIGFQYIKYRTCLTYATHSFGQFYVRNCNDTSGALCEI